MIIPILVAVVGAVFTAYADTHAAEAAGKRQDEQIARTIGGPPAHIERRASDARRAFEPGDPAVEAWYQAYEREFGPNPTYAPGAKQNPVPIPYTV